jgi:choline monooxygenase
MNVDALHAELSRLRGLDPDKGESLSPEFYTCPDWHALERRRIFRKEWICIGRSSDFPNAGDYQALEIDEAPIIVVRRRNGELGAMSAVCMHRMALIAQGEGCAKGFTCPYHGWTYDLDGRLMTAPRMPTEFERQGRVLPQVRIDEWNGFVYVNLDANARPLTERLRPLTELLAPYHMERMRTLVRKRHTWRTNWKVLVENFLEVYHINVTHPQTLVPYSPASGLRILPRGDGFQFYEQRMPPSPEPVSLDPRIAIANEDMDEDGRQLAYVGCVFPTHLFSVTWDSVFWLSLQPRGTDEIDIDVGLAGPFDLPPGERPDPEHPNLYWITLIDMINEEDRTRVEAVQRGARSGFGRPSVLHPQEATISGFVSYLFEKIGVG